MNKNVSAKQVETFTRQKISQIIAQSKSNARMLAELGRGIGKAPGEVPQLWGYFLDSMPEEFYGDREPSRAEWAVYTSLTLFVLHQQGKNVGTDSMQQEGMRLGTAIARLIQTENDRERISRRFYTIATANSMEELSHYMRGVVQLLRGKDIGLDYPALAGDIYCFQFPELVARVRLKWGQDFYRYTNKKES